MSRRAFLGSATLLTACAVSGPLIAAADAATTYPSRSARLSRAGFAPALGRTLTASGAGLRTKLRLVTISDVLGARPGSEDSFLLQFSSSTDLPDGVYTLTRPGAGAQVLFLCAVNRDSERRYEAVVNQLPTPAAAAHR